ncbi:hypothetical protein L218DRAFT_931070 [Marasmius fiardii PR-910]|nr:hypothetical protein L218DRAFT_931070 [Marasmius fiardii PR-910]
MSSELGHDKPREPPTSNLRIWICSHPRTCSNLLFRLLEGTEILEQKRYTFLDAFYSGPERQTAKPIKTCSVMDDDVEKRAGKTYQNAINEISVWLSETEAKGKIPTFKDHGFWFIPAQTVNANIQHWEPRFLRFKTSGTPEPPAIVQSTTNSTLWPTELLSTFTVIFTIRHPAKQLPSYVSINESLGESTMEDPDLPMIASMKWQRMVYDQMLRLHAQNDGRGSSLIVIDGDRLVADPKRVMEGLFVRLGLDPSQISYQWNPVQVTRWPNDRVRLGMEKIFGSAGVIPNSGRNRSTDLDVAKGEWAREWGERIAEEMVRLAEETFDDYEYLLERSI